MTRRVIAACTQVPEPTPVTESGLTSREQEVLRLVARGLSNTEIASTLFISEATVSTHINRLLAKLGLRDRAQAVRYAYESGVVRPGSDPG
ncbi:response regulator transcription factor [Planotetraspora sp. GP83]|uniref:response regulator transcription factor n=1 Tax=Planotetraspora sp. GP83 TaxID=3156264 RepID=UPI003513D461